MRGLTAFSFLLVGLRLRSGIRTLVVLEGMETSTYALSYARLEYRDMGDGKERCWVSFPVGLTDTDNPLATRCNDAGLHFPLLSCPTTPPTANVRWLRADRRQLFLACLRARASIASNTFRRVMGRIFGGGCSSSENISYAQRPR